MKELIHHYGAWIVFALVFLESIGLPLPGEAILVSAAIFAGTTQELGIALILLSAVLGAMLGSTIGFWNRRSVFRSSIRGEAGCDTRVGNSPFFDPLCCRGT